jgi:hypothetical protein
MRMNDWACRFFAVKKLNQTQGFLQRRQVMKWRVLYIALFSFLVLFLGGCGGSGGSSTGTVSMSVTDAKPMIPGNPTELWITVAAVRAHKSGGDWVTLPMPNTPLLINLLAFQNGNKSDLVPPVQIESGKYTQLRFEISRAYMVINGSEQEINLDVPSGNLRTDKNFTFDVPDGGAVNLTVDFDLSQSIVVTGNSQYTLKPVLHLMQTQQAATIKGEIAAASFVSGNTTEAVVTVIRDTDGSGTVTAGDEEYTKATVTKESDTNPTAFQIFWVVPGENYIVQIDMGGDGSVDYQEAVSSGNLLPGGVFALKGGAPI